MDLSVSILIPCYNVETTVEHVVTDAYKTGKTLAGKLEIIAVDDASVDDTAQVLSRLKRRIPVLRVITHGTNQGYGKTIKELYYSARHNLLFSLPGDDQFDAGEIRKLIPHLKHADIVLGWRNHRHDPSNRLVQSRVYNLLLNTLFGLNLHDVNTIRLMKKSVIRSVRLRSDSAFVDAELAVAACDRGFTILEIPVVHKSRPHKGATGGKLFRTILPTVMDVFRLQLTRNKW